jgi:rhodanese-related sulfurtransferase
LLQLKQLGILSNNQTITQSTLLYIQNSNMHTITVEDLKAKIDAGEKLNLLDVREPHEHAAFNIGGQLLPLGLVQALMLDEVEHLKEETVYVYCRSGNRSGQACMMMEPYGFKNVVNVVGGMLAWQEKFPA